MHKVAEIKRANVSRGRGRRRMSTKGGRPKLCRTKYTIHSVKEAKQEKAGELHCYVSSSVHGTGESLTTLSSVFRCHCGTRTLHEASTTFVSVASGYGCDSFRDKPCQGSAAQQGTSTHTCEPAVR